MKITANCHRLFIRKWYVFSDSSPQCLCRPSRKRVSPSVLDAPTSPAWQAPSQAPWQAHSRDPSQIVFKNTIPSSGGSFEISLFLKSLFIISSPPSQAIPKLPLSAPIPPGRSTGGKLSPLCLRNRCCPPTLSPSLPVLWPPHATTPVHGHQQWLRCRQFALPIFPFVSRV